MHKSVCVIGAGLAGGIVASTLAARGHPVTLLELGAAPAPLQLADAVCEGLTIEAPFTRGSGIGGTSNFWHGGLTVLDKTDMEGAPGEGAARTPLRYAELRNYYEQALGLLRGERRYSLSEIEAPPQAPIDGFDAGQNRFRLK